jgi:uncharacterized membrane protein
MSDDPPTTRRDSGARAIDASADGSEIGAVAAGRAAGTIPRSLTLGLLAAPGLAEELATELGHELPRLLGDRLSGQVAWVVPVVADDLAADARAGATGMIDAARRRMLDEGWDLVVCLTDLPLRIGRRPVVADASATHGVALVCLPALGAVQLRRRVREAVLRLVDGLLGEGVEGTGADAAERRRRIGRRLAELATPVRPVRADDDDDVDVRFVAAVVRGNLRLLAGMVRANRPWRLIVRLSRALAAALGAVVFAIVTSDIWRLADRLGWVRLTVLTLASLTAIVVFLIVAHGLWERSKDGRMREQVVLFNVATTLTLALGVLSLYAALFLLALGGAAMVVTPSVLSDAVGHAVGVREYMALAWTTTSLATVAGALGAGLESDAAVREAAYGYRPERQTQLDAGESAGAR